jgi:hypothetical protein
VLWYYCQLEAELAERLGVRVQLDASRGLAAERDNLLAAVIYSIDTLNVELVLRIVRHSPAPGMQHGFAFYLPLPANPELPGASSHDLYPYALALSAALAAGRGDLDPVEDSCQEALQAARRLSARDERGRVEYLVTARRERLTALVTGDRPRPIPKRQPRSPETTWRG